jgi:hypothetical protein
MGDFMSYLKRTSLFTIFMLLAGTIAFSQSTSQESKQGTGVISGRVTMGGAPARGVTVIAMRNEDDNPQKALERLTSGFGELMFKVKTDEDGNFRFADLIPSNYRVFVQAPAMVGVKSSTPSPAQKAEPAKKLPTIIKSDEDDEDEEDEETAEEIRRQTMDSPMRHIELSDGQTVESVNFSLARGGVITGRVTYLDGRPVIGEMISVSRTQGNANTSTFQLGVAGTEGFTTDDRGIYRVYGLADGRYKISVDVRGTASSMVGYTNSALHKRTYYPDVTDETTATTVEVSSASEVRNIDIKIGVAGKTYVVTGRVIEADTGKPVPDVSVVFEKTKNSMTDGRGSNGMTQANSKGEFRLESVASGSYVAYSLDGFLKQSDFYGEPLKFEVKDGNLSGVTLKMRRGAIISGVVMLEGANNLEAQAKLVQQTLGAMSMDENKMNAKDDNNDDDGMDGFSIAQSPISPDGSFMLKGLRAGKVHIGLGGFLSESPFAISRIERSGMEQQNGLIIKSNETISDIRIIVAQKNCVIRGRIAIEGGTLPKNARLQVSANRVTHSEQQGFPNLFDRFRNSSAKVDAKGEFKFEGLIPGEYQVTLVVGGALDLDGDDPRPPTVQQNVIVTSDREAEVTLVLVWKTKSK